MIVPRNGATGGEKVGGGSVRGTRACLRAAPLLCCPVALHAARLPCCPAALLPCCPAAAHAGMLPCSQAAVLMRRVVSPDKGAAVLPRCPATALSCCPDARSATALQCCNPAALPCCPAAALPCCPIACTGDTAIGRISSCSAGPLPALLLCCRPAMLIELPCCPTATLQCCPAARRGEMRPLVASRHDSHCSGESRNVKT